MAHSHMQDSVGAVMLPALQLYVVVRPSVEGMYPVAHATLQELLEARNSPAVQALELPAVMLVWEPNIGTVQGVSANRGRAHSRWRACVNDEVPAAWIANRL